VDLVRAQLQLFDGRTISDLSLDRDFPPPSASAVQLRVTAEDPTKSFQLSPGTIHASDVVWPAGRGVRIDTWLSNGPNATRSDWTVGTDFDSLLAKIIVRGASFEEMNQKAQHALSEFGVAGPVHTNASMLAGLINHPDWVAGDVDTLWLERNADTIIELGNKVYRQPSPVLRKANAPNPSSASSLLQPGSLFHLTLAHTSEGGSGQTTRHSITLSSIKQNAFPETLSGTLQTSFTPTPFAFTLSQSSSAAVSGGSFELADPNNHRHIATPLTGKIVELHPALIAAGKGADAEPSRVKRGETVMVLSVMKMENTVLAPVDGTVARLGNGIQIGAVIGEGMLICILGDGKESRNRL
jgi:pyruvate carboxylase